MNRKTIAITAAIAVVGIGALASTADQPDTAPEAATTTLPPTTTQATTTTTTTTVPESATGRPEIYGVAACASIDITQVSSVIPDDWDEWCMGYWDSVEVMDAMSPAEFNDLCSAFWGDSDENVIARLTDGTGVSRDRAIGAVDSMWLAC